MRVIAGTARGMSIFAPKGKALRPTPDRAREALFSILADRTPGADFLDLFAGTGANGIEALSRGARSALFVDNSRPNQQAIEQNLHKTKLSDNAKIRSDRLPQGLQAIAKEHQKFDIIFADPPYDFPQYTELLQSIFEYKLLKHNGIVVIEHAKKNTLDERYHGLSLAKTAKYGKSALSFYECHDEPS